MKLPPSFRLLSLFLITGLFFGTLTPAPASAQDGTSPHYGVRTVITADGTLLDEIIIDSPPYPSPGYELQRAAVSLPEPNLALGTNSLSVPAFRWSFGCSATSGAMIAGYYDRSGYPNMYTGPTNGGMIPLDSSSWPDWTDGNGDTYAQCPLTATHQGLDGRTTRGSIDDYWVKYNSNAADPYITHSWTQHTWGEAIGDYMKTSQSTYSNKDGSTTFYTYAYSASQLTCSTMEAQGVSSKDGTYGRKLFYEARGYTVTDCYSQKTDNNSGGFTFALYKAEIDAGRPVMLNIEGHTIVGVGYADPSTVYLHDTWDYLTHTMTWGGSYDGRTLLSVSVVNLQTPSNPVPSVTILDPASATAGGPAFTLTVQGSNFKSGVSTVRWNGSSRSTTFISSTQLQASILASDIASAGSASVTVYNSPPGGGTSNALSFAILPPYHTYVPFVINSSESSVINGDFESGPGVGWTEYSLQGRQLIFSAAGLEVAPHGGIWAAWLGGHSDETGSLVQLVTVPGAAPYLTYWYYSKSEDFCYFDFAYVYVSGTIVKTYNLCQSQASNGWVQDALDLSSYAGTSLAVKFLADTDGSLVSSFFLDDVAFSASTP
jgi:hypothetical protein